MIGQVTTARPVRRRNSPGDKLATAADEGGARRPQDPYRLAEHIQRVAVETGLQPQADIRAGRPQGLALRARIVLACADGHRNTAVAARLRVSRGTVDAWNVTL